MLPMTLECRRGRWALTGLVLCRPAAAAGGGQAWALRRRPQAQTGYSLSRDPSMLHSLYLRREFVESLATFLLDEGATSVVEFGSGSGRIARLLADLGVDTLGIESIEAFGLSPQAPEVERL
mmetsp:Transcript_22923/g.73999  ORF Transcript_22923/g.73999 Transcript_22923/m.73999 type:complete len:122 (-) Transcript_22923:110-475(-)